MGWAYVAEGATPEPEYFEVWVQRRNSSSDWKTWVSSNSASINNITPSVTDY